MNGSTRIFELTCDEFRELIIGILDDKLSEPEHKVAWVYGLKGLAEGLGCGKTKAQEIKNSHAIDGAIEYCGKSYRVNLDKARELLNRRNTKKR